MLDLRTSKQWRPTASEAVKPVMRSAALLKMEVIRRWRSMVRTPSPMEFRITQQGFG
jgi:hypothetical protein